MGFGIAFIVIAILSALKFISINNTNIILLSIAALVFALAEFCNSGLKLMNIAFIHLAFNLFSFIAFKRFEKLKKYIVSKKGKTENKVIYNLKMYSYWYSKCIANFFSRCLRKRYEKKNSNSILSLLFYTLGGCSLVFSVVFSNTNFTIFDDLNAAAIAMLPIGLMFVNLFFESEFSNMSSKFMYNVDFETKRMKEIIDEFEDEMLHPKIK